MSRQGNKLHAVDWFSQYLKRILTFLSLTLRIIIALVFINLLNQKETLFY